METLPALEPIPKLRIRFDDVSHPGASLVFSLVDCSRLLRNCINHVLRHLYAPSPHSNVPETRSVTLVLRPMGGVAYTTGLEIDDMHKEIHCSLDYIENFAKEPLRCRDEVVGVITHEMVHCYQYNGIGTAPGGLIEGIADFVRLKAGLAPPHWRGAKDEIGEKWDSGYQKTAYFLDWLETKFGVGTVCKLNESMRITRYEEETFWTDLFGKQNDVDTLWNDYRKSFEDDQVQPASMVDDEPVLVEAEDAKEEETQSGGQTRIAVHFVV